NSVVFHCGRDSRCSPGGSGPGFFSPPYGCQRALALTFFLQGQAGIGFVAGQVEEVHNTAPPQVLQPVAGIDAEAIGAGPVPSYARVPAEDAQQLLVTGAVVGVPAVLGVQEGVPDGQLGSKATVEVLEEPGGRVVDGDDIAVVVAFVVDDVE